MKSSQEWGKESAFQAEGPACVRDLRQERACLVYRPESGHYDWQDWRKVAQ